MYSTNKFEWGTKRTTGVLLVTLGIAAIIQIIPTVYAIIFLELGNLSNELLVMIAGILVITVLMATILAEISELRSKMGIEINIFEILITSFWIGIVVYIPVFLFSVPLLQLIFKPVAVMETFSQSFIYFLSQVISGLVLVFIFYVWQMIYRNYSKKK